MARFHVPMMSKTVGKTSTLKIRRGSVKGKPFPTLEMRILMNHSEIFRGQECFFDKNGQESESRLDKA